MQIRNNFALAATWTKIKVVYWLTVLTCACLAVVTLIAQDALSIGGNYTLLFENQRVRVLRVKQDRPDLPPVEHEHPARLAVRVAGQNIEPGSVVWTNAERHAPAGKDRTYQATIIEFKGLRMPADFQPSDTLPRASSEVLLENSVVCVLRTSLQLNEQGIQHSHPDRIVVFATPCRYHGKVFNLGDAEWAQAETHANQPPEGDRSCEVTEVELKVPMR